MNAPAAPVRLGVIDDHEVVLQGLAAWVEGSEFPITLVKSSDNPEEVIAVSDQLDVLLLDVDLGPNMPTTRELVEQFVARNVHVLIVSAASNSGILREAVAAGAAGFIPKREGLDAIGEAVMAVQDGEMLWSSDLAAALASGERRPQLSDQELGALQLYAAGLTISQVAHRLGVKDSTAWEYVKRVRAKYRAAGRPANTKTDLYRRAVDDGYLET